MSVEPQCSTCKRESNEYKFKSHILCKNRPYPPCERQGYLDSQDGGPPWPPSGVVPPPPAPPAPVPPGPIPPLPPPPPLGSFPPTNGAEARQALLDLIERSRDDHFVFFFGGVESGKSTVLASLIHSVQRPEVDGKLYVLGHGDGSAGGMALWNHMRAQFKARAFPSRSTRETIQMRTQYEPPNDEKPLNIVFLEMSGEDLASVSITDQAGRVLPAHIDVFLKIKGLKLVFLITTAWTNATADDSRIDDFLTYIKERAPHLVKNRFMLLVTKWDSKAKESAETIDQFVRRTMPLTYNKLAHTRNIVQPFSIGNVIESSQAHEPVIADFDHAASQRLFGRIYETFTNISSNPLMSLWQALRRRLFHSNPWWKIWS